MSELMKLWESLTDRERDALVAEKVMRLLSVGRRNTGVQYETHLAYYLPSLKEYRTVPHYSTSIADAWPVVEKLIAMKIGIAIKHGWTNDEWCAHIMPEYNDSRKDMEVWADTAPEAICLAALKAVGA